MNTHKIINLVLVLVFGFVFLGLSGQVSAQEPTFFISACRFEHWISINAGSVPLGTVVNLKIFDGSLQVYTDTSVVLEQRPGWIAAKFEFPNFELLPGFIVTATSTDPPIEKTLIVSPLEVQTWDLAADTVSGIASRGNKVNITVVTTNGGVSKEVVADATTGEWTTDFFGFDPEQGWHTIDLVPGSFGVAFEEDADGDNTWNDWNIPNPYISVRALYGDQVDANAWPTGAILTLTIDNPNTAVNPDYQAIQPAEGESAGQTETYAHFNLDNIFDIQPGFLVNVTDGTYPRTYTVTSLHYTNWNKNAMDTDIVTGIAQPNTTVEAWACSPNSCNNPVFRQTVADGSGIWKVDFTLAGGDPAFDLTDGTWVDSQEKDINNNRTMYGRMIPNQPPIAEAGPDLNVNEGSAFFLDASGSYSLFGDPLTYTWDLDGDGLYDDASGVSPSLIFPDDVTKIFGLKVTDPFEWASTDTVQVTVANVAPVVTIQPILIRDKGNIKGVFSFTDPGTDLWSGMINFGDGESVYPSLSSKSFTFNHKYARYGDYSINVCVRDDDGGLGCAQKVISVIDNHPPVAEAGGPYSTDEGSSITLTSKGSTDPENNIVLTQWDLDNDGLFDDATGEKIQFAAIDNGTFMVRVRVTDQGNLTSVDSARVIVNNLPPLITSLKVDDPVQIGTTVKALVKFTDPGVKDTFTVAWNWGDGTKHTFKNITVYEVSDEHGYGNPGTYNVTVTITDNSKGTVTDYRIVTIKN